jgi:hypothetical protein
MVAATMLAGFVTPVDLDSGSVFPPLSKILDISLAIAVQVALLVQKKGWNRIVYSNDEAVVTLAIQKYMFRPTQSRM